jgi:hypothetical protein
MSMHIRNELAPCKQLTFQRTILEDIVSAATQSRKLSIVRPAMVDQSSVSLVVVEVLVLKLP